MLIPLALAAAGIGFTAVLYAYRRPKELRISFPTKDPTMSKRQTSYVATVTIPSGFLTKASTSELAKIVASASKWAKVHGIPVQEILATIHVESRGKVRARAHNEREDSRGLMQVNINTWGSKLAARGYTAADLYNIDKNIEIGSEIYAAYRRKVQNLIEQSGKPQPEPLATIVRQYYRGPATVKKAILAGRNAAHVFAASDKRRGYGNSVSNWQVAMHHASGVTYA